MIIPDVFLALSVTIAIGCSLLVLNVLIFTALYYRKDTRNGGGGHTHSTNSANNSSSNSTSDIMADTAMSSIQVISKGSASILGSTLISRALK